MRPQNLSSAASLLPLLSFTSFISFTSSAFFGPYLCDLFLATRHSPLVTFSKVSS
jgi:hypothetical protein